MNLKLLYRALRYRYRIDPNEIKFIQHRLQRGQVAVDVGAHKGGYLYWLQKMVGQQGQCFAFEPQIQLFERLSLAFGRMQNVQLEHLALSDKPGKMTLHIPESTSGSSPGATLEMRDDNTTDTEVTVTTLDDYFLPKKIYPNLIKIDVEGHELALLKGGQNLLGNHHPILMIEIENRHLNMGTCQDVIAYVENLGYKSWFYNHTNELVSAKYFDADIHQKVEPGRYWAKKTYVNNFIFW